ncbi:hypothetical protein [Psychrobacter sp. BF1]|uniref:hypothetical protein n=1 Tax=Psychrobacter sp. BF1 TaxID=2821147 RepID=UPI001C4E254B|nr:hypothetical protein [Psychrobacter sp. BF1]
MVAVNIRFYVSNDATDVSGIVCSETVVITAIDNTALLGSSYALTIATGFISSDAATAW